MLDRLKGMLNIGVARGGVAVLHSRAGPRRNVAMLDAYSFASQQALSAEQLMAQWTANLNGNDISVRGARIVLADHWVRYWMVTPPSNAARLLDCQAATEARFQALFGEPSTGWQISADWHARKPFLAAALPLPLLLLLRQLADQHRLVLLALVPQFIACWNRWRGVIEAGHWFAVLFDGALTLGAIVGGRVLEVRCLAVPASADSEPDWLRAAVHREALRLMQVPPTGIALCGEVPQAWQGKGTLDWVCRPIKEPTWLPRLTAPDQAALQPLLRLAATGMH